MTYPAPSTPVPAPAAKPKGKGMWITGLVMLVVGIVMMVGGAVAGVGSAANLLSNVGAPQNTPGAFTQHLDRGTYYVYELVLDPSVASSLSASDITITDPGGNVVGVSTRPASALGHPQVATISSRSEGRARSSPSVRRSRRWVARSRGSD